MIRVRVRDWVRVRPKAYVCVCARVCVYYRKFFLSIWPAQQGLRAASALQQDEGVDEWAALQRQTGISIRS